MLTIRTCKCNTIIKKPSSALFLWLHNSKGWFVGQPQVIRFIRQAKPACGDSSAVPSSPPISDPGRPESPAAGRRAWLFKNELFVELLMNLGRRLQNQWDAIARTDGFFERSDFIGGSALADRCEPEAVPGKWVAEKGRRTRLWENARSPNPIGHMPVTPARIPFLFAAAAWFAQAVFLWRSPLSLTHGLIEGRAQANLVFPNRTNVKTGWNNIASMRIKSVWLSGYKRLKSYNLIKTAWPAFHARGRGCFIPEARHATAFAVFYSGLHSSNENFSQ